MRKRNEQRNIKTSSAGRTGTQSSNPSLSTKRSGERRVFPDFLQVHEVHYDDHGKVTNVAHLGARIAGDSVEEIRLALKMIEEAIEKPILDYPGDDH